MVRTTSHTRVGGRTEVSVGGRVEVRRALGRARNPESSGPFQGLSIKPRSGTQRWLAGHPWPALGRAESRAGDA